jgi:hypothetical protein
MDESGDEEPEERVAAISAKDLPTDDLTMDISKRLEWGKLKCSESLWGALPLPGSELLPNGTVPVCREGRFPVPIQLKNVLKENTTGALSSYSLIPENVEKYKQIYRDEARTKGYGRPTTAEITSNALPTNCTLLSFFQVLT